MLKKLLYTCFKNIIAVTDAIASYIKPPFYFSALVYDFGTPNEYLPLLSLLLWGRPPLRSNERLQETDVRFN